MSRSNLNIRPNEEQAIGRESDDVIESQFLNINDLQNITSFGTKNRRILYNEELLLLSGPEHPPRRRQGLVGSDGTAADGGQGIYGGDYLRQLLGVGLRLEAAMLVCDEMEEMALGGERRRLWLVCDGRAGDRSCAPGPAGEAGNGGKGQAVGSHL